MCIREWALIGSFTVINLSSGEIDGKTLSVRNNFISNINLGQTNCFNLDKFGISNDVPDCQSASFQ